MVVHVITTTTPNTCLFTGARLISKKPQKKRNKQKQNKTNEKKKQWSYCKEFKLSRLARLPIGEKGKTDAYE